MMYNPRPHQVRDESAIRAFVAQVGTGTLVTASGGRIDATLLPVIWSEDRVRAHFARANPQVAMIGEGVEGLWVVQGPDGYVSPGWYASKREHGRVVPTWNYSMVQLRGTVRIHDEPAWARELVTWLSDLNEEGSPLPWQVSDAPDEYIEQQLRAVVGVEMEVSSVEAKAKWSQNSSQPDQAGVLRGLRERGAVPSAEHMAAVLGDTGGGATR